MKIPVKASRLRAAIDPHRLALGGAIYPPAGGMGIDAMQREFTDMVRAFADAARRHRRRRRRAMRLAWAVLVFIIILGATL